MSAGAEVGGRPTPSTAPTPSPLTFGPRKPLPIVKRDREQANGGELDGAPREFGPHVRVPLEPPRPPLGRRRDDRRVVHHLFRHKAEAEVGAHELVGLAEERVERFRRAVRRGARVTRRGKGRDAQRAGDRPPGEAGGVVEEGRVLHVFRRFLERGQRLVEVDWQADARQVFAHALFDDRPERVRALGLGRGREGGAAGRLMVEPVIGSVKAR